MKRTYQTVAVALAVVLTVSAAVPLAATAQTDNGLVGDVFDDEDDGTDWSERVLGLVDGVRGRVAAMTSDDTTTAAEAADNLATTFNSNSSAYQGYINNRTTASTDANVLAVELVVDDETTTRYLVADVNTSTDEYRNASMVNTTDRTVDETCTLSGHAARSAGDELATFREEYVETGEDVDERYLARLGAEYGGSVSCTFDTSGGDA